MANAPLDLPALTLVRENAPSPALKRARPSAGLVRKSAARATPWWLWPHLLSLDAPVVALVWQQWWSRQVGQHLTLAQRTVLGLGVWLIYLADRVADTARRRQSDLYPARHLFAARRQVALTALAASVCVALIVIAPWCLDAGEFRAGLLLLAAAGWYFWLIHRRDSNTWTRYLPKEAVVGAFFALGTCFFTLAKSTASPALPAAGVLFGVCCFLNCALISSWERTPVDRRDPSSFINTFPRLARGGLFFGCWLLALVAAILALATQSALFAPIALSAALLGLLNLLTNTMSPNALRCLVDLVLLTPLLCLLLVT